MILKAGFDVAQPSYFTGSLSVVEGSYNYTSTISKIHSIFFI